MLRLSCGMLFGFCVLVGTISASQSNVHINGNHDFGTACAPGDIKPLEGSGCTAFVMCSDGHWYYQSQLCPPNQLWNSDKSTCDYAGDVDVSTCSSRHHAVNLHTTSNLVSTNAPTTPGLQPLANGHSVTCGHQECFHAECRYTLHCDHNGYNCGERQYFCHCNQGYVGEKCDKRIVYEQNCVDQGFRCHNGYCVHIDVDAAYVCYCQKGYTGNHCDKQLLSDSYCSTYHVHCHHGECVYDYHQRNYGCHCAGQDCDKVTIAPTTTVIPTTTEPPTHLPQHGTTCGHFECFHGQCSRHSQCSNGYCKNYHRCDCHRGYTGDNCEQRVVNVNHCRDGGLDCHHGCVYDTIKDEYACHCNSGWTGRHCVLQLTQEAHCWHAHLQCHHGECVHPIGHYNYSCHCHPEYTGTQCSLRIVSNNECLNHGVRCIHGTCLHNTSSQHGSYSCDCQHGYTGEHCDLQIVSNNECSSHGVQCNHGTCLHYTSSQYGRYRCNCEHGYTGAHCDTPATTTSTATTPSSTTTTTTQASTTTMSATSKASPSTTTEVPTSATTTSTASTTSSTTTTTPAPTVIYSATPSTPSITVSTAVFSTSIPSSTITTAIPIHYNTCDTLATVMDLGNQTPVNDTHGGSCPSGSLATPEAFVIEHCNVNPSSQWTEGVNVMKQCSGIPLYTPVAIFSNQAYASSGGLSGIFLGCLPNGFKLGVQQCGILPTIIHINYGGLFTMDPTLYYTVQ